MALPRKKCPRKGIVATMQGFPVQTTGRCIQRTVEVESLDGDRRAYVSRGKLKTLSTKAGERARNAMYALQPTARSPAPAPVAVMRFERPQVLDMPRGLPGFMDGISATSHFGPLPSGLGAPKLPPVTEEERRRLWSLSDKVRSQGTSEERAFQRRLRTMLERQQALLDNERDEQLIQQAPYTPFEPVSRALVPMSPRVMRGRGAHFEGAGGLSGVRELKLDRGGYVRKGQSVYAGSYRGVSARGEKLFIDTDTGFEVRAKNRADAKKLIAAMGARRVAAGFRSDY